jgi:hypothetical protein
MRGLSLLGVCLAALCLAPALLAQEPAAAATSRVDPIAPPAAATSPTPPVSLTEMAARYGVLISEAGHLANADVTSADDLAQSIDRIAGASTRALGDGAAAYAVVFASGAPRLRRGVADMIDLAGRDAFVARLRADPAFARRVAGADDAVERAARELGQGFARLNAATERLTQQAYASQRLAWAKVAVAPQRRIDAINAAANATQWPQPRADVADVRNDREVVVSDALVAAAVWMVLEEEGEARRLIARPSSPFCVNRAQLNARQCYRAAGYPYEQMFCLAKHALEETGSCLAAAR